VERVLRSAVSGTATVLLRRLDVPEQIQLRNDDGKFLVLKNP
jgi:hypothetical protein